MSHNFINTSSRNYLAIYNGKDANSSLGVLFECKSLSNKAEMMTTDRINVKDFQEIIAYYHKRLKFTFLVSLL